MKLKLIEVPHDLHKKTDPFPKRPTHSSLKIKLLQLPSPSHHPIGVDRGGVPAMNLYSCWTFLFSDDENYQKRNIIGK